MEILLAVGAGVLGGIARAFTGFVKNAKGEDFDWKQAALTSLIGGVIGGAAGASITLDAETIALVSFAGNVIIEAVLKIFKKE